MKAQFYIGFGIKGGTLDKSWFWTLTITQTRDYSQFRILSRHGYASLRAANKAMLKVAKREGIQLTGGRFDTEEIPERKRGMRA